MVQGPPTAVEILWETLWLHLYRNWTIVAVLGLLCNQSTVLTGMHDQAGGTSSDFRAVHLFSYQSLLMYAVYHLIGMLRRVKCSLGQEADSRTDETQGSKLCWQSIRQAEQKDQGNVGKKSTFNRNFWYSSYKVKSTAGIQGRGTSVTIHEMFWNVASVAFALPFISVDSL